MNYYNEHDPAAAAWLRELINQGSIPPGEVDERSIEDVRPTELSGFAQCHFFAGIGGWPLALALAGISPDDPIWTGSCPCQPFSSAGKGAGFDDERHLWPHFHYLIEVCHPVAVLGEQVCSPDGIVWIDLVQADLEGIGYAFGKLDLPAAGIGAPHRRQRLYWVAESISGGRPARRGRKSAGAKLQGRNGKPEQRGGARGLVLPGQPGLEGHAGHGRDGDQSRRQHALPAGSTAPAGAPRGVADAGCGADESTGGPGETSGAAGQAQGETQQQQRRGPAAGAGGASSGVAQPDGEQRRGRATDGRRLGHGRKAGRAESHGESESGGPTGELGDAEGGGFGGRAGSCDRPAGGLRGPEPSHAGQPLLLGDSDSGGSTPGRTAAPAARFGSPALPDGGIVTRLPGPPDRFWRDPDWLLCRDGKWRPVEAGTFPLADGLPAGMVPSGDPGAQEAQGSAEGRAMRLKGYGNAILPPLVAAFILAWLGADDQP